MVTLGRKLAVTPGRRDLKVALAAATIQLTIVNGIVA
jgi:hypothetical protein